MDGGRDMRPTWRYLRVSSSVQAPRARAGNGEEQPGETEQGGVGAAVRQRPKALRRVKLEVRHGHLAAENERNRAREEPDEHQGTAKHLEQSADAHLGQQ